MPRYSKVAAVLIPHQYHDSLYSSPHTNRPPTLPEPRTKWRLQKMTIGPFRCLSRRRGRKSRRLHRSTVMASLYHHDSRRRCLLTVLQQPILLLLQQNRERALTYTSRFHLLLSCHLYPFILTRRTALWKAFRQHRRGSAGPQVHPRFCSHRKGYLLQFL
jgi:hypothetical protein